MTARPNGGARLRLWSAQGLPESRVGTFTQQLYDEAKKGGWSVVSMKNDWNRIFAWDR